MTLTEIQALRLTIQDIPTLVDSKLIGDGSASSYLLPHRNISTGSAFVPAGITAWTPTGATFNESGMVSFATRLWEGSAYRLTYVHSNFSDAEIQHFLDTGGSQNGAALEAVKTLMFDGLKRARWAAPDGSSYDDTAAIQHLQAMYDRLKDAVEDNATVEGGVISWAINQGYDW